MSKNIAHFRFYEELNDFLPDKLKKHTFPYQFDNNPSVKDAIEAIGIPHPEIDLILVNGTSVGFDYQLKDGDRVSVYPVFENLDISAVVKLRKKPLRESKFVLDVHLGKLARLLRMLGFDTLYSNKYKDPEIIEISVRENRIILTRDQGLLKNSQVTHGYWVRNTEPYKQIREIVIKFDLFSQVNPFNRCMSCNGLLNSVTKKDIYEKIPPKTAKYFHEFKKCSNCGKIYWKGTHYSKMVKVIQNLLYIKYNSQ